MWRYLLDTNILSHVIRDPTNRPAGRLARLGGQQLCTSIIVAAELRYGAIKSRSSRLARRVDELLATLDVVPFQPPADSAYGEIRAELERVGMLIGPNDLLIAAQARTLDLTLVTDNVAEFSRVPHLRIENWLR